MTRTRGDVCHRRVEVAERGAVGGEPACAGGIQSGSDAARQDAGKVPHPAGVPQHGKCPINPMRVVEISSLGEHSAPDRAFPNRETAAAETVLFEAALPEVADLPSRKDASTSPRMLASTVLPLLPVPAM